MGFLPGALCPLHTLPAQGLCICRSCCLELHLPLSSCGSFGSSSSPQCHFLVKTFPSLTTCPISYLTPLEWELWEGGDSFCPIHQNVMTEAHFSCLVICGRQCSTVVNGTQPLGQDFWHPLLVLWATSCASLCKCVSSSVVLSFPICKMGQKCQ